MDDAFWMMWAPRLHTFGSRPTWSGSTYQAISVSGTPINIERHQRSLSSVLFQLTDEIQGRSALWRSKMGRASRSESWAVVVYDMEVSWSIHS
jgi:hypothetical protein